MERTTQENSVRLNQSMHVALQLNTVMSFVQTEEFVAITLRSTWISRVFAKRALRDLTVSTNKEKLLNAISSVKMADMHVLVTKTILQMLCTTNFGRLPKTIAFVFVRPDTLVWIALSKESSVEKTIVSTEAHVSHKIMATALNKTTVTAQLQIQVERPMLGSTVRRNLHPFAPEWPIKTGISFVSTEVTVEPSLI